MYIHGMILNTCRQSGRSLILAAGFTEITCCEANRRKVRGKPGVLGPRSGGNRSNFEILTASVLELARHRHHPIYSFHLILTDQNPGFDVLSNLVLLQAFYPLTIITFLTSILLRLSP